MGNGGLMELVSFDMPSTSNTLKLMSGSLRESWVPEPLPPPITLAETDDGPLWGPFFFFSKGFSSCDRPSETAKLTKIGL